MSHSAHHSPLPAALRRTAHLPDEAATERAGGRIAERLVPGTRIYLKGELGSGKTSLVRGMLRSLGFPGAVKSPSYTLVELYVLSRLDLYHFDFYRFVDQHEFEDAGLADHFHGAGVCLVEWPERAGAQLPLPDLELALAYCANGREVSAVAYTDTGEQCLAAFTE
jgi:tRNA threonylcarbamoyladenosine biosynthesis protein TsaE